ncbi:hypothetical protein [Maribacter antarcticus]|uniref:hypothetical protein n=1 Tax=Maribacter antarcticus TaxID=505250 RepID=UPI0004794F28|nr:hypothetical protein [Maribacter antarcticus]
MRKLITLFTFFFVAFSFGQENQISESDLVGYWISERIIKKDEFNISVYKRSNIGQKGTTIRFLTNGEYHITHNLGKGRGRCGNEIRPKKIIGYFRLDPELQKITLESYDTDPIKNWEIVWIDENSLGVKKT